MSRRYTRSSTATSSLQKRAVLPMPTLSRAASAGLAGARLTGLPGDVVTDATGHYTGFVPLGWSGKDYDAALLVRMTKKSGRHQDQQGRQQQQPGDR